MSGNRSSDEVCRPIDPVRELEEVIRLIHFLGKSKPTGFTAALGWAEEKLCATRAILAEHGENCSTFTADNTPHRSHAESFPLMSNLTAFCGEGSRSS